mmetsp:Transcript_71786/g.149936  ORF Transcript_71786/g.149936 Transcript_71786/m.149936 type:complete len:203 (-) Transcript_71786:425-1033(-)
MRKTQVCSGWKGASCGMLSSFPLPVMNTTRFATPRCVTGIPAARGPARAEEMPGITLGSKPRRRNSITSSPPRPKTNGSPILRRATFFPSKSASTHHLKISRWASCAQPGSFLATFSSPSTSSKISAETNRSATTRSAVFKAFNAATVSRSGSPGPAPTRVTSPRCVPGSKCSGRFPSKCASTINSRLVLMHPTSTIEFPSV